MKIIHHKWIEIQIYVLDISEVFIDILLCYYSFASQSSTINTQFFIHSFDHHYATFEILSKNCLSSFIIKLMVKLNNRITE